MLHHIGQIGARTVAGAAAEYFISVADCYRVFGVKVRKDAAFIHQVVMSFGGPPLHGVASRLVICCQLHQAEIGPSVGIHINQPDLHAVVDTSFVSAFS